MKLKQGLLYMILDNPNIATKYSKAFLNLKNVIELEKKENSKFDKSIIDSFNELSKKYNSFLNKVPLRVVETYFRKYAEDLEYYVYLEYEGNEVSDLKIIDIYIKLEDFFSECFELACKIADFYNLEIKLNKDDKSNIKML